MKKIESFKATPAKALQKGDVFVRDAFQPEPEQLTVTDNDTRRQRIHFVEGGKKNSMHYTSVVWRVVLVPEKSKKKGAGK